MVTKKRRRLGLMVGFVVLAALVGSSAALASTTIHGTLTSSDPAYSFMGNVGPTSCNAYTYGYTGGSWVVDAYRFSNPSVMPQCVTVRLTPGFLCTAINSFAVSDDSGGYSLGESGRTSGTQQYSFWAYPGTSFIVNVVGSPNATFPGCTYTLSVSIGRLAIAGTQVASSAAAPARP